MKRVKIWHHVKVLLTGFASALSGAATLAFAGLAVVNFATIPADGGYMAVCRFFASLALLAFALGCMYEQGKRKRARKRKGVSTHD